MLITQSMQNSESLLDIVKDATRYQKELEALKKARKEASDALAKLTKGNGLESMMKEAEKLRKDALALMEEKIAYSEHLLADTKEQIKQEKATVTKQKKVAKEATDAAKAIMQEAESLMKKASDNFSLSEKAKKKAEAEYEVAMKIKQEWTDKVQDLKQRLKGII